MKKKMLICGLLAISAASLAAQQGSATDPYSGTSNPPPDDQITVTAPPAKPHAGKVAAQPAADPAVQSAPDAAEPAPRPTSVDPAVNFPNPGNDDDIVHPVRRAERAPEPALTERTTYATAKDPDGDIVHPHPPRPGELAEGTSIRVHLLSRLSTATTEKGEAFSSRVASDVVQGGAVLIPAGAKISGHVAQVSSGHLGSSGMMRLRPETVVLPDGKRFRLHAGMASAPGSRTHVDNEGTVEPNSRVKRDSVEYGGAVGAGLTTGAIVGGPVGAVAGGLIGAGVVTAHLLVSHPQAVLEPGTVLVFTLTEPLDMTPAPLELPSASMAAPVEN